MFKKLNKKGFTLAELLVVVAIISVLVAVSIPIFTSQLNKAREATDIANERAGKAAAVAAYMTADEGTSGTTATTYFYDAAAGQVKTAKTDIKAYGHKYKATQDDPVGTSLTTGTEADHTSSVVKIVITPSTDGTAASAVSWEKLTA